jgi:hypothetical protein
MGSIMNLLKKTGSQVTDATSVADLENLVDQAIETLW